MKKLYLYCCFLMLFSLLGAQGLAGQHQVSGKVVDTKNEPLIGVNIVEKGTSNGVITDIDGNYSIEVTDGNAVLVFSFIGFDNKEIPVNGQRSINVTLEESLAELDEVVVVGYGTQKKASVTGAVSQIEGEKLLKAPVGNITSKLGGVVPGVISLQQSGQPGADAASLLVRGSSAKYIVDGIERDFSEIDPNEIESVSVLKDASSAAIYGMDANAVIIITTKRGQEGDSQITFNAGYGISENTQMLDLLDGPEYAYWYNKAREMDGDQPVFSSEHVEMMQNDDPTDGWGNTNWYDKTFDIGTNKNFNVNASGGNENIKYFTSLGYFDQEGNVSGFNFDRINLRSNIDAVIAENLDLRFDISARVEDRKRPGFSANPGDWNNIPQQAIRAHPYAVEEIDGVPVSTRTASSYVNPIAASEKSGYNNVKTNIIQTNLSLNYHMPFIPGLQAKFLVAYDMSNQTSKSFSTPYYTYVANPPTSPEGDISYSYTYDPRGETASLVEGSSKYTHLTTNSSLKYDNQFGNHNISALALLETIEREGNNFGAYGYGFDIIELDELDFATLEEKTKVSGGSYIQRQVGFVGRLNYDYASKYLAELSFRYDGSYVFGGMNDRWGAFPAASLGWRISEESWFDNLEFVNNLKLRGGIGLTGTTEIPPYYYLNTLSFLNNPAVVIDGEPQNGLITSRPANRNLTWAKALQYNAGFDAIFWKGRLGVEFDVFYKYIYDMLSSVDATYPPSFGGYVPGYANNNEQDHKGFEINLSHRNKIGDFSYNINLNGTYTKRRWLRYGDSPNTPDWLKLTGKEVGSQVGFIAEGLFQSQEEIDNSPLIPGKDVRVGDIKYKDRNGDGVITYEQDRGYIGKSAYPKFIGGFSFSGEWRNFDVSFLFQGALGRDVALTGVYPSGIMDNTSMTKPFYHGGNSPKYLIENSWREDNPDGEFPRLAVVPASSNNAYSSSFWYRNGDYLRLKNMQIGYTLPQRWIASLGMSTLRIYAEGQNLLTFSELTKYNIDPEQPGVSNGYYPQQRIYSMGVKLTF
ncbi:SusC/RagA family TonB-linked outer membrane protein [Anaerophaga thermohalophila]|uniref:SusC/RagA family TonB-linked outer membrane protein n=1 Tax=Anaerophaga thermohalophila TaxID=177400 RepID=UPI0002FBD921|nr:TonB-dependent receptor [Anaerophaga thermohalophila]